MKDYMINANKFFKETGIDVTRMISFEDTVAGAGRLVGENVSSGSFMKGYTDLKRSGGTCGMRLNSCVLWSLTKPCLHLQCTGLVRR
jgi:hypothetical protein